MDMPFGEFLVAVLIAAGVSMLVFRHAERNGSEHATAWGVGAFLLAGVVVPVYVIRHWLRKRSRPGDP
jgi:drug/metabolite transporter (DMT)-like permease